MYKKLTYKKKLIRLYIVHLENFSLTIFLGRILVLLLCYSYKKKLSAFLLICFLCWDGRHGDVPLWLGAALLFA